MFKKPKIREVAKVLREINDSVDTYGDEYHENAWCDVRLQVYADGSWAVRYGDPSYDQDHRGYWGESCVPGCRNGKVQPFNSIELAKELIDQAEEHYAESVA